MKFAQSKNQRMDKKTARGGSRRLYINRDAVIAKISRFKHNGNATELDFPTDLTSFERRNVHEIATKLGLGHESVGEGKDRRVRVFKLRKEAFPSTQSDEDEDHSLARGSRLSRPRDERPCRSSDGRFSPLDRHTSGPAASSSFSYLALADDEENDDAEGSEDSGGGVGVSVHLLLNA
mmetsp:Transcript_24518/g.41099  ORF Transcript_24518/g.41099 Transcript_24518/m.41099 type:complete len:178 (+) Transcript_24518:1-534(+)